MKTVVMMTGEYEFDTIFYGGADCDSTTVGSGTCLRFSTIGYILMIAFIIVINISLMNLLIGLAIGDIDQVSKHAALKRQLIKVCGGNGRGVWSRYAQVFLGSSPRYLCSSFLILSVCSPSMLCNCSGFYRTNTLT